MAEPTNRPIWFDSDADRDSLVQLFGKLRPEIQEGEKIYKETKGEITTERYKLASRLANCITTIQKVTKGFKSHPDADLATIAQGMDIGPTDESDDSEIRTMVLAEVERQGGTAPPDSSIGRLLYEGATIEEKRKLRERKIRYLMEHCGLTEEHFRTHGLGKELLLQSKVTGPILQELFDMRAEEHGNPPQETRNEQ